MPTKPQTSALPGSLHVYCTAILSQSNYDFTTKSDRNALEGIALSVILHKALEIVEWVLTIDDLPGRQVFNRQISQRERARR